MNRYGKVAIGFSRPYFAKVTDDTINNKPVFAGAKRLARGTEVSLSVESADQEIFYADNIAAETSPAYFLSATLELTVDGLLNPVRREIYAMTEPDINGWTAEGDTTANVSYYGVGYIVKYLSGGETVFVPTVIGKCKPTIPDQEATTQGESIDYQTETISFNAVRGIDGNWRYIGSEFSTEDAAEAALVEFLGGNASALSALTVTGISQAGLTPTFNAGTFSYEATADETSGTITATAAKTGATVKIMDVTSSTPAEVEGTITWATGNNKFEITVTNGSSSTVYELTVTKGE